VDGFFGASPETLVTVRSGALTSRVLAGTVERGGDPAADETARSTLLDSPKNRFEHALAVDSLLLTLGGRVDDLALGRPFALRLPNVWHLATDATARVRAGLNALDLVAALHPTAAVAGAPQQAALELIHELEPFDRGRYAGPVGWIDGTGDGEWAIGLRSAQIETADRVRAYAGAGVVAGSVAEDELAETGWKFAPVLEALGADPLGAGPLSAAAGPRADSDPLPAR
jgi:menaquinone-specific isochorismate synthase